MPGTYTGEPIMYPLFGYSYHCDIDNIESRTIPDDVIYDASDFIWTREDALYFLWMVRSLTIKVSNTSESGIPLTVDGTHENIFMARRSTYPDDSIYERTCSGTWIPSESDTMLFGGMESHQLNISLRNKFNGSISIQLLRIYNEDNDFLGYALNGDTSFSSPASRFVSTGSAAENFDNSFVFGIPTTWNWGTSYTQERYIYPLSLNGITIPISVAINTGSSSTPFIGDWSHTVTDTKISVESYYDAPPSRRRKTLSTIELLDVELYQQAT